MAHLRLKLTSQNNGQHLKQFEFSSQGGSIGRSDLCEWTLFDEERFISKKHAEIFFQNNQFYVSDSSTNGIYINNTSNLLGSGNSHILKLGELLIIGEYQIVVDDISLNSSSPQQASNNDLLDLVMGTESSENSNNDLDPLSYHNKNSGVNDNSQDLGLNDILDNPVSDVEPESSFSSSDFRVSAQPDVTFGGESFDSPRNDEFNDDNLYQQNTSDEIPLDWELSGIMPAISDEYLERATKANESSEEKYLANDDENLLLQKPFSQIMEEKTADKEKLHEQFNAPLKGEYPEQVITPLKEEYAEQVITPLKEELFDQISAPLKEEFHEQENTSKQTSNYVINKQQQEVSKDGSTSSSINTEGPEINTPDVVFETIYKHLELPEQYMHSVNKELFAEEIAEVLLLSTKGLMSLLNGRTVFKQESRLSLTSIQPRSNNPLKFSIDPSDSLEMLLLKKKTGYMDVQNSYKEAISDIQSHQMAFLAGLQATLNGILNELEPEKIEAEAAQLGKNFMGLNSTSKAWKLYAEKQKTLATNVKQNLNDVLSKYFADTYQAQIDSIKENLK